MPTDAPARKRRWPRIVLLQVIVLVAGLTLVEIGFRLYLRVKGEPYDAQEARQTIELARSRAVDLVPQVDTNVTANRVDDPGQAPVLHPYLGYIVAAKLDQLEVERTRIVPEYDGDFEILVVGGSVAAIFGPLGTPRMVEILKEDPRFANRRIYAYQYGVGGFKAPQMTALVDHMLVLGFTPECVIDIDGFNDVALGRANAALGTNPTFPSSAHWAALTAGAAPDRESLLLAAAGIEAQRSIASLADRALRWNLHVSALLGTLVIERLATLSSRVHSDFDEYSKRMTGRAGDLVRHGPKFSDDARAEIELCVKAWEESSRSLRALCEARGIVYMHVLQPTLHDEGSKTLTKREIEAGGAPDTWIEGVRVGYPLLRAAGERLKAGGEHFVDATRVFQGVEKKLYFDNCHFNEDGNRILAERMARELLAILPSAK